MYRFDQVDGQSLRGFNNHQAVEVLRSTGQIVKLTLARYLRGPKYDQLQQAMAESTIAPSSAPVVSSTSSSSSSAVAAVPSYRPPTPPSIASPVASPRSPLPPASPIPLADEQKQRPSISLDATSPRLPQVPVSLHRVAPTRWIGENVIAFANR